MSDFKQKQKSLELTLQKVKDDLQAAKEAKDHSLAKTLREQSWVLTDMVKGVQTDLPTTQLNKIMAGIKIIEAPAEPVDSSGQKLPLGMEQQSLPPGMKPLGVKPLGVKPVAMTKNTAAVGEGIKSAKSIENRIKKLEKRIKEIGGLKRKKGNKEYLSKEQEEKINSEAEVKSTLQQLKTDLEELKN